MLLRKDVIEEGGTITTESLSAGENEILFRVIVRVTYINILIINYNLLYLLSYRITEWKM